MSDLTEAWKEACAVAPKGVIDLHTLEFRHPNFRNEQNQPTALRVVLDNINWALQLEDDAPNNPGEVVTFIGMAFEITPPDVDTSPVPEMKIALDNVSREIEAYLAQATASPYPVEVTYRMYLNTDLTQPQNNPPATFVLKNPEADDERVTASAVMTDTGSRQFPNEDYTLQTFPALRA